MTWIVDEIIHFHTRWECVGIKGKITPNICIGSWDSLEIPNVQNVNWWIKTFMFMAHFLNQWKGLTSSYNVVKKDLLVTSCGYLMNVMTYSSFGSSTLRILGLPLLKILGVCHFDVVLVGGVKEYANMVSRYSKISEIHSFFTLDFIFNYIIHLFVLVCVVDVNERWSRSAS